MELPPDSPLLAGRKIHGFNTLADLDVERLMEEAQFRWFRPNEVHAILSNYKYFKIQPQPVERPKSGTVLLFDRKVLRNFRKDGYNWRKKKDGKNVQEAHEKLKVGDEERVHVYYARSDDDPNFYRRSFWLLDKNLERIVLVHYRHTSEDSTFPQALTKEPMDPIPVNHMANYGSPVRPVNSSSGSPHSDLSRTAVLSEEINSRGSGLYSVDEPNKSQVNDFDWGELEEPDVAVGSNNEGYGPSFGKHVQYAMLNYTNAGFQSSQTLSSEHSCELVHNNGFQCLKEVNDGNFQASEKQNEQCTSVSYMNPHSGLSGFRSTLVDSDTTMFAAENTLTKESSGRRNDVNSQPINCQQLDVSISRGDKSGASRVTGDFCTQAPIFNIVDISPEWAYSTVETKVVVIGCFSEPYKHLSRSKMYCVFGETCVAADLVQDGVYRCTTSAKFPGLVDFFLTLDGRTPISQVLTFEHRHIPTAQSNGGLHSMEDENGRLNMSLDQVKVRLSHLLFSTANTISILSNKIQSKLLKEAKRYESVTSHLVEEDWMSLLNSGSNSISAVDDLCELFLKNKLQEWLSLKVAEGCKKTPHDRQGQGVIHLCAILDYAWAVRLFSFSGFSLDFRDAFGWTALHWAACYGREKTVAALLSAGANPSLVTDPTPENPGGCTAADLASNAGYEGLGAYLAEKGLMAHAKAMSQSGNITVALPQPSTSNGGVVNFENSENLSEQELCLKESLAAYRNAADAAASIQAAFRERALKQQTRAVQLANPVVEATQIVAALKIQHAFRSYNRRKLMKAAARIQSHFRTWQARKSFLNMRRQAVKIQAVFRGHLVRRQYKKIIWSVGVLEKAVLRWRLKRKGLRGMQTEATKAMDVDKEQEEDVAEEDFFRIGREQAEERMTNSVVKVQSMFRSYRAQQEYRRMKLAYEQAKMEYGMDGAAAS